jgi:hypothetical protein
MLIIITRGVVFFTDREKKNISGGKGCGQAAGRDKTVIALRGRAR